MGFALVALVIFAITSLASPLRLARVSELLADPGALEAPAAEAGIYAISGDLRVPVGEAVQLRARDFTGSDAPLQLEIDRTGGFWQAMDTFKDKMMLDDLQAAGNPPWQVWREIDELDGKLKPAYDSIKV